MSQTCQEETHASQQIIRLYERTCRRNMKKRIQRQDLQKKAAVGLRAATAFLYAPTRPRLSPHGVKKQSAGAPAFDAIN
jgi:hypothetical protein